MTLLLKVGLMRYTNQHPSAPEDLGVQSIEEPVDEPVDDAEEQSVDETEEPPADL